MKILHCITGLDIGGAERQLVDIVVRLRSRGMQIDVAYLKGSGALAGLLEAQGVTVHDLRSSFGMPGWILGLISLIRKRQFDILHTHLIHATLAARAAALVTGLRCVFTTEHNTSNWHQRRWLSMWANRLTARGTARMYAISAAVAERMRGFGRIPSPRIHILHDGVDLTWFDPGRTDIPSLPGIDAAVPLIVCVGRLDIRKGQDTLLRSMAILLRDIPSLRLMLVGSGREAHGLRSLAIRLGVDHAVRFEGAQEDVRPYLSAADVVVQPSREEGLSISILEALAMGRPVVATAVGGIPEIISHGVNGSLVPPDDPERLADEIVKILKNESYRSALIGSARPSVMQGFSLDEIVDTLTKDYVNCHTFWPEEKGKV